MLQSFGSGPLVLPAQGFVTWIAVLLAVRLLCCPHKALYSGLMFCNLIVVKLPCCPYETFVVDHFLVNVEDLALSAQGFVWWNTVL